MFELWVFISFIWFSCDTIEVQMLIVFKRNDSVSKRERLKVKKKNYFVHNLDCTICTYEMLIWINQLLAWINKLSMQFRFFDFSHREQLITLNVSRTHFDICSSSQFFCEACVLPIAYTEYLCNMYVLYRYTTYIWESIYT